MHMLYHITKGIYQFVANKVRYIPTKYHKNRSTFDFVIVKIKREPFLKHSVVCFFFTRPLFDAVMNALQYQHNLYSLKSAFSGLQFCCRHYGSIFICLAVVAFQNREITRNSNKL